MRGDPSAEKVVNHASMHIGKTEVSSLIGMDQPFVIDSEQVQYGGIEIVDVHGIFGDVVGEVIGFAVTDARLHTATGYPDREGPRMVIGIGAFAEKRAPIWKGR